MAELATERMIMRASPAHCYEVVTDFERYPDWAHDIKGVTVLERDDEGHTILCQAEADARVRTIKSTVRYTYNAPTTLAWRQEKGELKSVDGRWESSWGKTGDSEFLWGDDALDRIAITGHHLEWMALTPKDLRPSESLLKRAVLSLRKDVESLPPLQSRSFKSLLPVSHAARALALLRGEDGFTFWRNSWKAEQLRRSDRGFVLSQR